MEKLLELRPEEVTNMLASFDRLGILLGSTRALLAEIYPTPLDVDAYQGITELVPAMTAVKITWRLRDVYKYYIKDVYVDAAADTTYNWEFTRLYNIAEDIRYPKDLSGNEHHFGKPLIADSKSKIILTITNTGAVDRVLDIFINMWARRAG